MNHLLTFILLAVATVVVVVLWRKGYLLQVNAYVQETKEELRKCSWPTTDELKGSTVVVLVATMIMGAFTMGVDFVITLAIRQLF